MSKTSDCLCGHPAKEHDADIASCGECPCEEFREPRCSVLASGNHDEDMYRCIHAATVEWFSLRGEWEPICARHALGLGIPQDRLRPLTPVGA